MSKVSFTNLKLKVDNSTTTIKINDTEIEVLKYLSWEDKYTLINMTLQKSQEEMIFNPMKVELYFNLYLIYLYTNINFTEKQKEDEAKLYDILLSNGVLDKVCEAIPEDEYNQLFEMLEESLEAYSDYNSSIYSIINNLVNKLPETMKVIADSVNNFDPTKYKAVIDFAKAANGNRPLS